MLSDFLFPALLDRRRYALRMLLLVPAFLIIGFSVAEAGPRGSSLTPLALMLKLVLAQTVDARLREAGPTWLYRLGVAVSFCFIGEGLIGGLWATLTGKVLGMPALATPQAILTVGIAIELAFFAFALLAAVLPGNSQAYLDGLTRKIAAEPQNAKLYIQRARALTSLKRDEEAAADYGRVQEINPKYGLLVGKARERLPSRMEQAAARCLDDDRRPDAR